MKVFDNLWMKLLALVIGLLLWFHVATEKTYTHQVTLPITDITLGEGLTLSQDPPESLLVSVSATGKQLLRRRWREDGLRILATKYKPGRHTINLSPANTSLTGTDGRIALEEVVSPSNITLQIDYEADALVVVTPQLIAMPEQGFAVRGVSEPQPEKVKVIGPRSLLGQFTTVLTEERELTGVRSDIDLKLALIAPDGYGVRLEPDSVLLQLEVVPVKTRIYEKIPVVIYNAPVQRKAGTDPAAIKVEVTGPPEDIDLLNENAVTASIDFLAQDPTRAAAVKVVVPSNFKVRRAVPDSVRIVFK